MADDPTTSRKDGSEAATRARLALGRGTPAVTLSDAVERRIARPLRESDWIGNWPDSVMRFSLPYSKRRTCAVRQTPCSRATFAAAFHNRDGIGKRTPG